MTDEAIREQALDPRASVIVQAPAGSGKTELLIRRYLTLLAVVEEPEQIVAITFTRKAAAEMRQRIAEALAQAASPDPRVEPHRVATLELAKRALSRSDARDWALREQPERMRIETLDALNARLARQLPVLSGGVAVARVAEDAAEHYREAARRTLDALVEDGALAAPLRRLLAHFEHSAARLEALIAQLLPRREQWLRYFTHESEAALRRVLEEALNRLVAEELERAARRLPAHAEAALPELLRHAAPWLGLDEVDDALGRCPRTWRAVAELLLTKQDGWRQRLDRRIGFGPEHAEMRARLKELIDSLEDEDELRSALARVRRLPDPHYTEAQWRTLADLRLVLRRAAAELRIVFAERQTADFVEIALAARQALGAEDAPSDLLLQLDYRIQHILVDEFQDTSHGQLRLLEILTAGWEPHDGRTLFLVGDPMQSIYRFRDADMSLFLKVRQEGIGSVRCRALTLERNFRSAPAVIDWVNETLAYAFPAADDIGRGEVRFTPCRAARDLEGRVDVHVLRTGDERAEIEMALDLIERERGRDADASLAVLVQSRAHLAGLHRQLRSRGFSVNAVEIEPLREQQAVQDLLGLTRALLHPADTIAWLAVLRAPWCGLSWADLEEIATFAKGRTVWEALGDADLRERLSAEGRRRVEGLYARLLLALDARGEFELADWIERTWRALEGPRCLESDDDRRAVEQALATLASLARRGDLDDPAALDAAFEAPSPEPADAAPGGIEIMTIHRAKGLEFDIVVLLGLARETRREEQRALYWMERVSDDGREDLLMAPLPAPGGEDRLTALIREADEQRDAAERARLFYVAATRARRHLHLVCRLDPDAEAPPARSLIASVWPALQDEASVKVSDELPPVLSQVAAVEPQLRRIAEIDTSVTAAAELFGAGGDGDEALVSQRPTFEWAGLSAMQIGTLVHAQLQRIAMDGLAAWNRDAVVAMRPELERELALLGVEPREIDEGAAAVVDAVLRVLDDPKGRWILSPHREAQSELRLTVVAGGHLAHLQLDRTFVDRDGTRWIVDFKTGTHEGGNLDAFLEAEVERYRPQLARYAAAIRAIDSRPIKVGLYFPMLQAFRSWAP